MITLHPAQPSEREDLLSLLECSSGSPHAAALENLRAAFDSMEKDSAPGNARLFTVVEPHSRTTAGAALLQLQDLDAGATIHFWLMGDFWNPVSGSHVVRWLVINAFDQPGVQSITARFNARDSIYQCMLKKNGFQLEDKQGEAGTGETQDEERVYHLERQVYLEREEVLIVHLTTRQEWLAAIESGELRASLESEGFIHASRPEQILSVANTFYRSLPDPVLLWIYPPYIMPEIRWELVGDQVFPHIYGPLNTNAVLASPLLTPGLDGIYYTVPRA